MIISLGIYFLKFLFGGCVVGGQALCSAVWQNKVHSELCRAEWFSFLFCFWIAPCGEVESPCPVSFILHYFPPCSTLVFFCAALLTYGTDQLATGPAYPAGGRSREGAPGLGRVWNCSAAFRWSREYLLVKQAFSAGSDSALTQHFSRFKVVHSLLSIGN